MVLGLPWWDSHSVCRYETAISTLCGTWNSWAAAAKSAWSALCAAPAFASVVPPDDVLARAIEP